MKYTFTLLSLFICSSFIQSQVIIPTSTLPEIGEVQTYTTVGYTGDTLAYRQTGPNQLWSFDSFAITGSVDDEYADIVGSPLADSFPEANMIVSITGFESAAIRNDSTIEVIGLAFNSFSTFGIEGNAVFEQPFTFRKTPFAFGDSIQDAFSIQVKFPSELIPGLDTIEIPIPFATLDSIRVTLGFEKTEVATGWGMLDLYGDTYDVLHVKQTNIIDSKIEAGISVLGNFFYVDATDLVGGFDFDQNTTSYKFLTPSSKLTLLQFNEVRGQNGLSVNGRISSDIISSVDESVALNPTFTLSPNPASDVITFDHSSLDYDKANLVIFNTRGQVVKSVINQAFDSNLSVSDLPVGYYFISIITHDGLQTQQFQVVR